GHCRAAGHRRSRLAALRRDGRPLRAQHLLRPARAGGPAPPRPPAHRRAPDDRAPRKLPGRLPRRGRYQHHGALRSLRAFAPGGRANQKLGLHRRRGPEPRHAHQPARRHCRRPR
nr:hypothetical protein [Tanacetum cinerariifolium]